MAPVLLIMLATSGRAEAATPEEWAGLYSGRLSAANDWDPTQAITIYETILSSLSILSILSILPILSIISILSILSILFILSIISIRSIPSYG